MSAVLSTMYRAGEFREDNAAMPKILAHIEHKIKTERHWTLPGAMTDYFVVDSRDEAYALMDALIACEANPTTVERWMIEKLKTAYLQDAEDSK